MIDYEDFQLGFLGFEPQAYLLLNRCRHSRLSEVALSIVLLMGAGLLIRSFLVLTRTDLGFDPENVLYFVLNLPPSYNTDLPGSLQRENITHTPALGANANPPGCHLGCRNGGRSTAAGV